jgi:hypothetical protein
VISETAKPGRSIPHATTRLGLPDPFRKIRLPSASLRHPGRAFKSTCDALFSQPGGASSEIHDASADWSFVDCCELEEVGLRTKRTTIGTIIVLGRKFFVII